MQKLALFAAALALGLPLVGPSRAETAAQPRPVRVAEIVSLRIDRLTDGANSHRLTAVGRVPTEGWSNATLRPIKERHPNNAVAGFELVASPPKKGAAAAKKVTEITATLETTIGAIRHTVVVRAQKKSVACLMQEKITCE